MKLFKSPDIACRSQNSSVASKSMSPSVKSVHKTLWSIDASYAPVLNLSFSPLITAELPLRR